MVYEGHLLVIIHINSKQKLSEKNTTQQYKINITHKQNYAIK